MHSPQKMLKSVLPNNCARRLYRCVPKIGFLEVTRKKLTKENLHCFKIMIHIHQGNVCDACNSIEIECNVCSVCEVCNACNACNVWDACDVRNVCNACNAWSVCNPCDVWNACSVCSARDVCNACILVDSILLYPREARSNIFIFNSIRLIVVYLKSGSWSLQGRSLRRSICIVLRLCSRTCIVSKEGDRIVLGGQNRPRAKISARPPARYQLYLEILLKPY